MSTHITIQDFVDDNDAKDFYTGPKAINLQVLIYIYLFHKWCDEMNRYLNEHQIDYESKQIILLTSQKHGQTGNMTATIEDLIALIDGAQSYDNELLEPERLVPLYEARINHLTQAEFALIHSMCTVEFVNMILEQHSDTILLDMRAPLHVHKSELQVGLLQDSQTHEEEDQLIPFIKHSKRVIRLGKKSQVDFMQDHTYLDKILVHLNEASDLLDFFHNPHIVEYAEITNSIYQECDALFDQLSDKLSELHQGLGIILRRLL